MPAGRPSIYSNEITEEICHRLSEGESLRAICRDEGMPDRRTVRRWMDDHPDFAAKRTRAHEDQADHEHDEMARIEEGVLSGTIEPAAARVVLSSKQWRASKLAPKKYGERVQQEISGPNGGPIETTAAPFEVARRVAFLLAKAEDEAEG